MLFVVLYPGTPEGSTSTAVVLVLKRLRRKTFCGFSMGSNQYWAGRVYDLCVYYMTGTPEGSTESGFMEKPGIEPATPGLQGIALIHYTTGASQKTGQRFKVSFLKLTSLSCCIHIVGLSNDCGTSYCAF